MLINNAGISSESMIGESISSAALRSSYQEIFAVNTFGAALKTEAFLPLFSISKTPRLVFMSSSLCSLT
jgi:NAD(P)-dependent dehydrogenase (short-subunit alcohol dehydrogenase family)